MSNSPLSQGVDSSEPQPSIVELVHSMGSRLEQATVVAREWKARAERLDSVSALYYKAYEKRDAQYKHLRAANDALTGDLRALREASESAVKLVTRLKQELQSQRETHAQESAAMQQQAAQNADHTAAVQTALREQRLQLDTEHSAALQTALHELRLQLDAEYEAAFRGWRKEAEEMADSARSAAEQAAADQKLRSQNVLANVRTQWEKYRASTEQDMAALQRENAEFKAVLLQAASRADAVTPMPLPGDLPSGMEMQADVDAAALLRQLTCSVQPQVHDGSEEADAPAAFSGAAEEPANHTQEALDASAQHTALPFAKVPGDTALELDSGNENGCTPEAAQVELEDAASTGVNASEAVSSLEHAGTPVDSAGAADVCSDVHGVHSSAIELAASQRFVDDDCSVDSATSDHAPSASPACAAAAAATSTPSPAQGSTEVVATPDAAQDEVCTQDGEYCTPEPRSTAGMSLQDVLSMVQGTLPPGALQELERPVLRIKPKATKAAVVAATEEAVQAAWCMARDSWADSPAQGHSKDISAVIPTLDPGHAVALMGSLHDFVQPLELAVALYYQPSALSARSTTRARVANALEILLKTPTVIAHFQAKAQLPEAVSCISSEQ